MIFSSSLFLFLFLPTVLAIYYLLNDKFRNFFLLLASLFFYAWGEQELVLLMLSSISINYTFGILISSSRKLKFERKNLFPKLILSAGVTLNISILLYYKYFSFLLANLVKLGYNNEIDTSNISLPIGISFFTFQSISYLVDVYRKDVRCQKNPINLGMYISLFPQLIAGPIVRYIDISKEIKKRSISTQSFSSGITRFIIGLAKKVIIANNVGLIADKTFEIDANNLSSPLAWIGIICYTLQIYFDFSGYSDMAIGLGKMFGFNFKENFNYPYISTSIQEFWRRWHISLSTWFKDYLYIPLGGNRKGKQRTYINLILVFFITGLWHGASWNFVVWGLFHGFFIIIERLNIIKLPQKMLFLKRIYLLLVVMIGWVLFRAEDLSYSISYIGRLFSFSGGSNTTPYLYINAYSISIILVGIVFSTPVLNLVKNKVYKSESIRSLLPIIKHTTIILLFILSIFELVQATYNPFIYFRF